MGSRDEKSLETLH